MKISPFLLLIITFMGCRQPSIVSLSRDHNTNKEIIASLIPKGTHIADAERMMKKNGFDWKLHRDESMNLTKGSTVIGNTGSLTVAVCERSSDNTTWIATVILNDRNVVEDLDISAAPTK